MIAFSVIDADGHITETTEQLRPYFEGNYGERGALGRPPILLPGGRVGPLPGRAAGEQRRTTRRAG